MDHSELWQQVAAAADYLAATNPTGFTVWDAVTEAARDWTAALVDADDGVAAATPMWEDPDPLRTALSALLAATPPAGSPGGAALGDALSAALAEWVERAAGEVNDGRRFCHPL
jgi:hypothetical protein